MSLDRDAEAAATATVEAAGLAMGLAAELVGVAKALTALAGVKARAEPSAARELLERALGLAGESDTAVLERLAALSDGVARRDFLERILRIHERNGDRVRGDI